ncbi:ferritin-like fold-containing protein [Nocardioides zeae]|uniref:Ferritin-like fold-containing protein n=1 Tax=Nocardioides imazamoxiresistens TaxID=3231893 RepID=A0ABU3PYY4_9ACTN|nr:ferritin-like fold-containing protein [Nocardioides zeae]MDT9594473.1 ferritin-like fold-containing protein [Nocardioides zeae]
MTDSPVGDPAATSPASPSQPPVDPSEDPFADPAYRDAVVDLLGAIAYGEISAFERLAEDSKLAPTLEDKVALASMAAGQLEQVAGIRRRLEELGVDAFEAMAPFRRPIDDFHRHTAPADWYEGLVKAYVGDGLAHDFYREIAAFLDDDTRDLVIATLGDAGEADFVVGRVRAAFEVEPRLAGRLALWGRRLMGEALTQAQRVAAERDALAGLLAGGRPGLDLVAVGQMLSRMTERHAARMNQLGLAH